LLLEAGRLCVKKYGRDAGSRAVITSLGSDGFVNIITATRSKKERRCNPKHLEFLKEVIDVKNREQVNKALGIVERNR
jgi:ribosomal protein L14E/L6E/L27E